MLFAEHLTKSFGTLLVLEDISFNLGPGERVGLVGPNGAGKTTLLRILAGEEEFDNGQAGFKGGTIGYLRQEAGLDSANTLLEEMWTAFPEVHETDRRLHEIAGQIEQGDGDIDALIEQQGRLFEEFDRLDGYRLESRIGRVLDGLGFSVKDRAKRCGDFSGGWQMRIALAKVLIRRPDNLLLDEPTNHLDTKSRDWLAGELAEYRGVVLLVTHDGEFLDRVATRIMELRDAGIDVYAGNYTQYQQTKAARLQQQDQAAGRQQRELTRQQRFIDRFRAKQSKATVVKSREKMVAKI